MKILNILEDLSDKQDCWFDDLRHDYTEGGLLPVILQLIPTRRAKDLLELFWDMHFMTRSIDYWDDAMCELGMSTLQKCKIIVEFVAKVDQQACYKKLYNDSKYFWMTSADD